MKINELGFDELGRPCWDLYLMSLSFSVAQRSLDPNTKCGCIIVDSDNAILVSGYNSPPIKCDDKIIPLHRPKDEKDENVSKYECFSHAEESAIALAAKRGISINNSKAYVTGPSCHLCLRKMINAGIKEIIYGDNNAKCVDKKSQLASQLLLSGNQIKLKKFQYNQGLYQLQQQYINYLQTKEIK